MLADDVHGLVFGSQREDTGSKDDASGAAIHPQRIMLAIGAAIGMIATFVPWYYAPIVGALNGTRGSDGWITFGLFVPALLFAFVGNVQRLVAIGWRCLITLGSLAAVAAATLKFVQFANMKQQLGKGGGDAGGFAGALMGAVDLGPGLFMVAGAGLFVLSVTWLFSND